MLKEPILEIVLRIELNGKKSIILPNLKIPLG